MSFKVYCTGCDELLIETDCEVTATSMTVCRECGDAFNMIFNPTPEQEEESPE